MSTGKYKKTKQHRENLSKARVATIIYKTMMRYKEQKDDIPGR